MFTHRTSVYRAIIGLVLLSLMAARASAQGGWIFNPANGHEYRLTNGTYWGASDTSARSLPDWWDAEAEAVASGGHLVTINDQAENGWVLDTFGLNAFWIGLTDWGSEGSFHWISGEPVTYLNWDGGQPDNAHAGGEDAVHINHPFFGVIGFWNDLGAQGNSPYHPNPYRGIIEREVSGPVNQQPIADAGMDQTVEEGVLVALDGTGSSDTAGETLSYSWTQVAGPIVLLSDPSSPAPTFEAPVVSVGGATLTFQLVVSDGELSSEADTTNLIVTNINHAPVALAGDDQTVAEESPVVLDGSSSYDVDDDALTFVWTQLAGTPVLLDVTDPVRPTFTAPLVNSAGDVLIFELFVDDGLTGANGFVVVFVENFNHPPIADAGADQTHAEGSTVTLDASASNDPDLDTLSYSWTQLSGPAVTLSSPSVSNPSFTTPNIGPGGATLVFLLVVDDGYGGFDFDEVAITVQDTVSPPACELARASSAEIWPPNHKLVPISILGVTDPENGEIQITILNVTQDEPVNGLGDGDTGPDAVIQGDTVLLRAERSGTGNGRVYRVTFMAEDSFGGTCMGTISVCVPHSRSKQAPPCIDDGQIYNSVGL